MKGLSNNFWIMTFVFVVVLLFAFVNAQAVSNTPPVIDSIDVDPSNPTKYNDLTCFVEVSDSDGNLDYADFKWYVNGVLTKENTKLVYGSSDTTSDSLSSFHTDVWDYVVCKVWVYDFERSYTLTNHAVRVGNTVTNSIPTVTYVDITPRHPNPQQDLTCSILAVDADDNLDNVIFKWYRNNHLIRSSAKKIQGSSDTAIDTLTSGYTYPGDGIKCSVEVSDANGMKSSKNSLPVLISGDSYDPYEPPTPTPPDPYNRKPVAVITVDDYYEDIGEMVYFSAERSYDYDGYVLQYKFDYGDGEESAWLPQSTPYSYHSYDHKGTYYARVKVKDDQYLESYWSRPVAVYIGYSGYIDGEGDDPQIDDIDIFAKAQNTYVNFKCEVDVFDRNGDLEYVKFKWYIDGDFFTSEKVYISGKNDEAYSDINLAVDEYYTLRCEAVVYDEEHNADSDSASVSGKFVEGGKECSLFVNRFEYNSYLRKGDTAWVEIEIENTGSRSGNLDVELFVDGSLRDDYTEYLKSGDKLTKRFEFSLSLGSHDVKVVSSLPCGGEVRKYTEITIFPKDSEVFIPEDEEESPDITEISVSFRPKSLDIEVGSGKTIEVTIESPELETFEISHEGIPGNWINYPESADVQGRKKFYVYVVPKEIGNYDFTLTVKTDSETFEEDIDLYVAPASEEEQEETNGLTGMISMVQGNWMLGLIIILLLAVLVIMYIVAGRFKKKSYEELVYGDRSQPAPPLTPRMMKGTASIPDDPEPSMYAPVPRGREVDMSKLLPAEILKYNDGVYFPKEGSEFEPRDSIWGG